MLLYEAEGKKLLREAGLAVPNGRLVLRADETLPLARTIGFPCVVKAQTLSGKRWKRGLVAIATDEKALRKQVGAMGGETIAGFLVEEQIRGAQEFYVSVSIGEAEGEAVVMISPAGGVDVEESHATSTLVKLPIRGRAPWAYEVLAALYEAGIRGRAAVGLARTASRLAHLAIEHECVLAEINPLFLKEDGTAIVGDAKVEIDEDARGDHSSLVRFKRERDPLEAQAAADGISFVRLDGDIGTIVGGAGLGMLTVDAMCDAGLQPANFIDLQGSTTKKFVAAFELLAKVGVKAVLTNNAGGLNPCRSLAEGIVEGAKRSSPSIPIVAKLHGADEAEAWEYLERSGANLHVCKGTTADAVRRLQSLL